MKIYVLKKKGENLKMRNLLIDGMGVASYKTRTDAQEWIDYLRTNRLGEYEIVEFEAKEGNDETNQR